MRPPLLNPLFADLVTLKGIGPKTAKLLEKVLLPGPSNTAGARLVDLLFHLPVGTIDRRYRCSISQLPQQGIVTVDVTVGQHRPAAANNRRLPYRVDVHDDTGSMVLVFFKAFPDHLKRILPEGSRRTVSGDIAWFNATPQITHPDYVLDENASASMPEIEAVYPLTAGLSSRVLGKAISSGLDHLPALPEWQDQSWLEKNGWLDFATSLRTQHQPTRPDTVDPFDRTRLRLAYDELLANQLALLLVRRALKRSKGRSMAVDSAVLERLQATLPYQLTRSQVTAIADMQTDMAAPERMIRLLQGDVGSGKTVVALFALVMAVAAGTQGAIMVPTELLARQHLETLTQLTTGLELRVGILTGREKGQQRQEILSALRSGAINIVVGTHALFQEGVEFRDLGLVVVDEQHRFGVHQRLALQAKSDHAVDLLVMTATPIPRTLALTVYGDMDVSKLTEKPAGRKPVDTRTIPLSRLSEVIEGIRRSVDRGARIYWVCPLVEESDMIDAVSAEDRFASFRNLLGDKVGLVHGRLRPAEKDTVMADFKSGKISVLVSTTVVEVGVDVTEATVIVIENAERFGLAQLHQLRGRVGRGLEQANCILLYHEPLGEIAKARLAILRETDDGFRIAEEDFRLRGPGDVLGTQQSGVPLFRLADLSLHGELLAAAKDDVQLVLSRDPELATPRGEALHILLYLFARDEAVRLLTSG